MAALLQLSCYVGCFDEPSCGRPYYKRTADQTAILCKNYKRQSHSEQMRQLCAQAFEMQKENVPELLLLDFYCSETEEWPAPYLFFLVRCQRP